MFIAVTPKVSYGEFIGNPDFDQDQEHRATRNVINIICTIHRECGATAPFWTMEPLTADMILHQDQLLDQELEKLKNANLRAMSEDERDRYFREVQARAGYMWHERVHGNELVKMVRSLPHVQDLAGRVAALTQPAPTEDYVMSRQVGLSTMFTTRKFTCCSAYIIGHLLIYLTNSHRNLQQAPDHSCFALLRHTHVGPSFGGRCRPSLSQPEDVGYLRLPGHPLW